jgi:hypothetical protein
MRIVVALGGNALLRPGEPMTAEMQRRNIRRAVAALLPLFEGGHQLVITARQRPAGGPAGTAGHRGWEAARSRVPPVLIRSSMMRAVLSVTSPTNWSPETTPALRCLSANALATGQPQAASSVWRNSSARLAPPVSGDTTHSFVVGELSHVGRKQGGAGQCDGTGPEGVLECRWVMNLQGVDRVGSHGLK